MLAAPSLHGRAPQAGRVSTTMKKTYIIPQTEVFHTAASLPIATSDPNDVTIDTNSSIEASRVDVKEQPSFNAWDDDWSE